MRVMPMLRQLGDAPPAPEFDFNVPVTGFFEEEGLQTFELFHVFLRLVST
jgi:hypothetical protein